MSARSDNHPLPLPLDEEQLAHLRTLVEDGFTIASEGTAKFDELNHLAERDLVVGRFCKKAMGVTQFEITRAGREALECGNAA